MKNSLVEVMVKMMKKPMYRVMGDHPLTQTDLVPLISDCQAAANSRTLGYIYEDANNENMLSITPFHLIHGRGIDPIPHELYQRYWG